jgi:internalin A
LDGGRRFRLNIWDFGGQEIYHATHQFYLTKRSLYVLVTDTRKEDTDFYYWLNAIDLLSGGSPLLILKNEKQDRHREINDRGLRVQFDNLKEVLAANLQTKRGLSEVQEEIRRYATQLPHIGAPLPKSWVQVREALEENPSSYISLDAYFDICQQHGFAGREDKLQLSGYLHDLGVFLHFQDDPVLKKTIILKPMWGTAAVYKALDNRRVIENRGRFTNADLSHIWDDSAYSEMCDELLRLMMKFKLCYELPQSPGTYIAPQLLPVNQPDYEWEDTENIYLRYSYEFMPRGIASLFIVAMHKHINDQRLMWKTGVVLERNHTKAEVIEYHGKREIRVRLVGKHKKEFLSLVMYEIDKIHATYPRLRYSTLIPCNCPSCKDNSEPHFFSFELLRGLLEDRKTQVQCQTRPDYNMVDVRRLLDDSAIGQREDIDAAKNEVQKASRSTIVFAREVGNVVIQQAQNGESIIQSVPATGNAMANSKQVRSAWANGSFYLFVFLTVIIGLGVLARSVSGWALPMVIVAGVIFEPIIGAMQLRQDDKLSEKTFLELMRLAIAQLPLIGRLAREKPQEK